MNKLINEIADSVNQVIRGILVKDTWQTLKPCDVLLVRHDYNCGYVFHKKAYAHLIDSFGDLCVKKSLKVQSVAKSFSVLTGTKAQYSPVSYNRAYAVIILSGLAARIVEGKCRAAQWTDSRKVALWCDILDKANPKIVIGIQPDKYICRAGKARGIPVYDLQHGVIPDEDRWYGSIYRTLTPIEELPDGFLCWDDQAVATIAKWADQKGIRAIKVGNPWFLRFSKEDPDDLLVHEAIAEWKVCDNTRPCILVSLQWGMKDSYPDIFFNGVLEDALEKVILDTQDIYNWILRLHPVQIMGKERKTALKYLTNTFGKEKAQGWQESSQIPLPIVLRQADIHITYHSTVTIEAAWMGVKSALLNQQICKEGKLESCYAHERTIGMAEVIPMDSEIIKNWIADTLAKGSAKTTANDSSHALNAFIDEIARRCRSKEIPREK